MDAFIADIRTKISASAPELLPLFETMAQEAKFGRNWLAADIAALPTGASILEVGGGICVLSCALAAEGFNVTAIEPTGDGFGEFDRLRAVVLEVAGGKGKLPTIVTCKGEEFMSDARFDFAFSLNVMEHVESVETVITRVVTALKPGANYHFFCPNYAFPYEPHFNMPTLLNKRLTEKCLGNKIQNHRMEDAAGIWKSLNWITVAQVTRIVARLPNVTTHFARDTMVNMLERVLKDAQFASRRSGWMVASIRALVKSRLHRLVAYMPVAIQPIIDCRIIKNH